MVVVRRIQGTHDDLADPQSAVWKRIPANRLQLIGTPLGTQPTAYVRAAWRGRTIGVVDGVDVRLCHDGNKLYVRLEWEDSTENREVVDNTVFPDAAAVVFPVGRDAPLDSMGNEREGVNAWQWRGDQSEGRSVVAHGIGTTEATGEAVRAKAVRAGNRWQVVLARSLAGSAGEGHSVHLKPGKKTRIGIAVWEGENGERAGFKGYTENWTDLELAEA